MEFNAKRVDEANALVSATITKETVEFWRYIITLIIFLFTFYHIS